MGAHTHSRMQVSLHRTPNTRRETLQRFCRTPSNRSGQLPSLCYGIVPVFVSKVSAIGQCPPHNPIAIEGCLMRSAKNLERVCGLWFLRYASVRSCIRSPSISASLRYSPERSLRVPFFRHLSEQYFWLVRLGANSPLHLGQSFVGDIESSLIGSISSTSDTFLRFGVILLHLSHSREVTQITTSDAPAISLTYNAMI